MTDVVYILGNGSPWQDNELRYSLRSVEKHLKGYRNIYLIGEKPKWISDQVIHFPCPEDPEVCRERRIMEKVAFACQVEEISETFLFFNDDFFLVEDIKTDVPYFQNGTLKEAMGRRKLEDSYWHSIRNTHKAADGDNFDIHYPILYNKKDFLAAMSRHNWNKKHGYTVKSLYCNTLGITGPYLKDLKINKKAMKDKLLEIIKGRDLFSISDRSLNTEMKELLNDLYPHKSKYEI